MKTFYSVVLLTVCFQLVTSQSVCSKKSDIVFLVDNSGSITDNNPRNGSWNNWDLIRNFIVNIVNSFDIAADKTRIGVVTFGNIAVVRWYLNKYQSAADIAAAINSDSTFPSGNGQTNLYDGLNKLRTEMFLVQNGARANVPHNVIVITDGFANLNTAQTIPEAQNCWASGIQIFTIGMTSLIDETQLKAVSSPPQIQNQNYWTTPDYTTLSTILDTLQVATCSQPKPNYPACQKVELVVTLSIPQSSTDWDYLRTFIKQYITSYLTIGPDSVRVSVVTYDSRQATVAFNLSAYSTEADLKDGIDAITFNPVSNSEPKRALQLASSSVLSTASVRSDAQPVLVMFINSPTTSSSEEIAAAKILSNRGVKITAFGITSNVQLTELRSIASPPTDVISVNSYSQLFPYITNLVNMMCLPKSDDNVICPRAADIILLLDQSTSIVAGQPDYSRWTDNILKFAEDIVNAFPISPNLTQVGVLKFSSDIEVSFNLNRYSNKDDLVNAIKNLELSGGETNIAAALRTARQQMLTAGNGARSGVPKIFILLTDGAANREPERTIPEANQTKAAGIEIYTVGVTSSIDSNQLKAIASDPWETHYFYASDFTQLYTVLQTLIDNSCKKAATLPPTTTRSTTTSTTTTPTTTTTTTPTTTTKTTTTTTTPTTTTTTSTTTTPTTTTTTPTTTTTTTPTTTTTTRTTTSTTTTPTTTSTTTPKRTTTTTTTTTSTTTTPTTTTSTTARSTTTPRGGYESGASCRKQVDVAFVVDVTSNMDWNSFRNYLLEFIRSVVQQLDVDSGRTQVALVSFGDNAQVEFYLNNYTTTEDVKNAIVKIHYGGYDSNMASGLNVVRNSVFVSRNGARMDDTTVTKLAVVITTNPSYNRTATQIEAKLTRQAGIGLITVGVGTYLDLYELSAVASYPYTSNMLTVSTVRNMPSIADRLKRILCSSDGICSASTCQSGGTCQEAVNTVNCQCQPGFAGSQCTYTCSHSADVVMALDASGSIGTANFQRMTSFVGMIIEALDVNSRVGLLTFSTNVVPQFNLNTYTSRPELLQAVNVKYLTGSTNTAGAIRYARDVMFTAANGDRSDVPNYLVIMTDGMSDNTTQTWIEAVAARAANINILVIGIGDQINIPELISVASAPSTSNVILASNFSSLVEDIRVQIAAKVCNNENECSSSPCRSGSSCQDQMGGYTCSPCPLTSTGVNCEKPCSGVIDLAFILDSAGSVHAERWKYVLEFVVSIISQLDIGSTRTRVAVIYYSDTAYVGFYLNQYYVKQDAIQAVRMLPYLGGKTNTSGALNLLKTSVFSTLNGDRAAERNLAVLVVNGESTINPEQVASAALVNRVSRTVLITVVAESLMRDSPEILTVVSEPNTRNLLVTPTLSTVMNASGGVLSAICNDVNECQSSPCLNGGSCIDDYGRYYCRCARGYSGYNCERSCNQQLDVIFVIDASGSVQEEYLTAISFAKEVAYGLDIDSGLVRVGAVAYSTALLGQFYLNDYIYDKESVINALRFYNIGGTTNTAAAFDDVLNVQLTNQHGMRSSGVSKVVIVITDGQSNVNPEQTVPKAEAIQATGASVYAIANGENPQLNELMQMASSPSSQYQYQLDSSNDVKSVAAAVLDNLCGTS